jgi:Protein of unknown function (DUF2934)
MITAAHRRRGIAPGNLTPANPAANPENPSPPDPVSELQNAIRRRAEEIYERSGRIQGRDVQNWIQAEAEVRSHAQSAIARKAAIVVKVEGVRYVGEYDSASADGYIPGEFKIGGPVTVRLHGDWMYVMRPNGKELQTRVIERIS